MTRAQLLAVVQVFDTPETRDLQDLAVSLVALIEAEELLAG